VKSTTRRRSKAGYFLLDRKLNDRSPLRLANWLTHSNRVLTGKLAPFAFELLTFLTMCRLRDSAASRQPAARRHQLLAKVKRSWRGGVGLRPHMADSVAKLFAAPRTGNNRIRSNAALNRCYVPVHDPESILLDLVEKIVLQHYRHDSDLPAGLLLRRCLGSSGHRASKSPRRYLALVARERRVSGPSFPQCTLSNW
jgi:hypothetical protein